MEEILAEVVEVPKKLLQPLSFYLWFLMLRVPRHDLATASDVMSCSKATFSRMLNDERSLPSAKKLLNRAARRVVKGLSGGTQTIYLIIDATIVGRRSKKVENIGLHHSGKGLVHGHKFINFVLMVGDKPVPLSSIGHYSKEYCLLKGVDYKSEITLVEEWLNWLHAGGLFEKADFKRLHILADSFYDAKKLQKAITRIGAHFTMAIRSSRCIDGVAVAEYFWSHRYIPWETIRLEAGAGGKGTRREYRIRGAANVKLKGFGRVHVVCSEKSGKTTKTRKYLITSDRRLSFRDIVRNYRMRWQIEVWHKKMKQEYGFLDCHSPRFAAIEVHVNIALAAFLMQNHLKVGVPKLGTEGAEFVAMKKFKEVGRIINLFGNRDRLKDLVAAEQQRLLAA